MFILFIFIYYLLFTYYLLLYLYIILYLYVYLLYLYICIYLYLYLFIFVFIFIYIYIYITPTPTSSSCLLRTTHTHTHLTRNYICCHTHQDFVITHYYIDLFHLSTLMHNSFKILINNMYVTLQSSTRFEHQHAHLQEDKLYYHSIWYRHSL